MGRERSHLSRLRSMRHKDRAKFESELAKFRPPKVDVQLSSVADHFELLIADLTDQLSHQHCKSLQVYPSFEPLRKELVQLYCRSRNMLSEFYSFSCIELVLDNQSPLATQFMDFFCDLQWLLVGLIAHFKAHLNGSHEVHFPFNHICVGFDRSQQLNNVTSVNTRLGWIERCHSLLGCLKPVVYACIILHTLYKLSHGDLTQSRFQRAIKHKPRMFTQDLFHFQSRSFGDLKSWDLDSFFKDKRVELDLEPIGRGAFSSVYKGYFVCPSSGQKDDEPVAVKAICKKEEDLEIDCISLFFSNRSRYDKGSSRKDKGGRSKYLPGTSADSNSLLLERPHISELRKLVTLQHFNVVEVKGYIGRRELGNGLMAESGIVMKLMDESLENFMHKMRDDKKAMFTELEVVDLMLEIARAMRFLHENAITHRDLKTANILLKCHSQKRPTCWPHKSLERLEVNLGDFGLTKCVLHAGTHEHTGPAGTRGYMAPEIKNENGIYTDKADVYSYGITCLDIITGIPDQMLMSGKYKELYDAVACEEWKKWIKAMLPFCPIDVINIIEKCLLPDPSDRPTFATICLKLQKIKWRLLWPYMGNSQPTSNCLEKGTAIVFAKFLCNGLSGLEMIDSLHKRVPECPLISWQYYMPEEVLEHQRKYIEGKMEKEMLQHLHWRSEVLRISRSKFTS